MISQLLIPIAGTILFYVLFHALSIVYRELTSPLRYMAGPKTRSLLLGNSQEMMKLKSTQEDPDLTDRWRSEFGATFRFKGVFGISELHTSDIKAINHVISKSNVYRRAPFARARSGQLTGNGILSVDLDDHKHFNPVFGVTQMRVIQRCSLRKAIQLRDIWAQQVWDNHGTLQIEVVSWLRLMTLEIIGKAGFNYDFDALVPDKDKKPNEPNEVLKQIFHSPLSNRYAIFRLTVSRPGSELRGKHAPEIFWRMVDNFTLWQPLPGKILFLAARTEMFSIGHRILASSKADIMASEGEKNLGGKRD
ncbi:hypothetical protein B0H14DRAFT_2590125 [Mycena olivaceomarginata]|nr:hypothetical protein B0H14DRAFT_2590125 [Mycena olivaceomarginata]